MKRIRRVLYNDREDRLRALWRVLVTLLLFIAGGLLTFLLIVAVVPRGLGVLGGLVVTAIVPLVLSVAVLVIAAGYVDRRTVGDFGLRIDGRWWTDLAFGLGLGAALMLLVFLAGYGLGWYRVVDFFVAEGPLLPTLLAFVVLFVSVGIYEELLARGYLLTNTAEGFQFLGERAAVGVAITVSSLVFGVLHATNPGASTLSTAAISLAGVMLALGYVLTGELGVSIGLHTTWNFFQGPVFGFGVSGLDVGVALVDTEPVGPDVATGGTFGPEAGLLGIGAILVGSAAIAGYARWRDGDVRIHPAITEPELRAESVTEPERTETAEIGRE